MLLSEDTYLVTLRYERDLFRHPGQLSNPFDSSSSGLMAARSGDRNSASRFYWVDLIERLVCGWRVERSAPFWYRHYITIQSKLITRRWLVSALRRAFWIIAVLNDWMLKLCIRHQKTSSTRWRSPRSPFNHYGHLVRQDHQWLSSQNLKTVLSPLDLRTPSQVPVESSNFGIQNFDDSLNKRKRNDKGY